MKAEQLRQEMDAGFDKAVESFRADLEAAGLPLGIIQSIYDIGFLDGQVSQGRAEMANLDRLLAVGGIDGT